MENSSGAKPPVPKFSSFRPNKPLAPAGPVVEKREASKEIRNREQSRERVQKLVHNTRSSSRLNDKAKHSHSERPQAAQKQLESREPPKHFPQDDEKLFYFVDKKGDPLNATYGALQKVSRFARRGLGSVMGLGSKWKIDRVQSTNRCLHIRNPYIRDSSGHSSFLTEQVPIRAQRLIKPVEADTQFDVNADYIELGKKRKRPSGSSDEDGPDYRSIGPPKAHFHIDSDLETEPDSDGQPDYSDPRQRLIREKNADLLRRAREDPKQAGPWLKLIYHQDQMVQLGRRRPVSALTEAEKKNLSDLKVAIYEEALSKLPQDQNVQETLFLDMLHEGAATWENKKLAQKWEQAVTKYPMSIKLRVGRLNFLQTSFSTFSADVCKAEYIECLRIVGQEFNAEPVAQKRAELALVQVYVLLRFSCFLRDAGYHEQALALWQASLDFIIFRPASLTGQAALESFGKFWDSEAVRLAESKRSCWRECLQQNDHDLPDPVTVQAGKIHPSEHLYSDFVKVETRLEQEMPLPGRALDNVGEDDPFHVILFSDISPVLSNLIFDVSAKWPMIAGFLCYAGLPPLHSPFLDEACLRWWDDPFLHPHAQTLWPRASTNERKDALPASFKSRKVTTESLFLDAFQSPCLVDEDWLFKLLHFLTQEIPDSAHLREYFVAYLLQRRGAEVAAKQTKEFLKSGDPCTRLYNAYYVVECRRGNIAHADKTLARTINESHRFGEDERRDVILLWRTWIWQKLRENQIKYAMHLLLSLGEQEVKSLDSDTKDWGDFNSTTRLRSRKWLDGGQNQALYANNAANFALFTEVLMLFAYFERSFAIDAAEASFQKSMDLLKSYKTPNTSFEELAHQARASLASYDAANTKPYKPANVRAILLESISAFPRNTTFLELFVNHERSFGINDRLRINVPDLFSQDCESTWLLRIWSEANRGPQAGGSIEVIRSLFEKAVLSKSGMNSIAIWTLYLQFEIAQGQAVMIKSIFLRATRAVPWCKSIIMLGISALAGKIDVREVRDTYGLLDAQGLRTHVSIVDVMEEMGNGMRT